MIHLNLNCPLTSSVGRLFDAVAALLGVRESVNYEGQAAIELEQRAAHDERSSYEFSIVLEPPQWIVSQPDIIRAVLGDLSAHLPVEIIAARFHNTLARLVAMVCEMIRSQRSLNTVALSGGVFQNEFLLTRAIRHLEERKFQVLTHHQVPPNDGGISFGQAVVAAAQARRAALSRSSLLDV